MTHPQPTFVWHDDFAVGLGEMDDTHHEFVDCVSAMLDCRDDELPAALARFAEHARSHFGEEDRWMAQGYESAGCHVDEHAAVLRSVDEVQALLAQGQVRVARALASELARWFPEHARVMDLGLARWIQQKRLGGAPVRIHRRMPELA